MPHRRPTPEAEKASCECRKLERTFECWPELPELGVTRYCTTDTLDKKETSTRVAMRRGQRGLSRFIRRLASTMTFLFLSLDRSCADNSLDDLSKTELKKICDRIGLSMEEHVLPYLFEEDENDVNESAGYTHEEYVRGAEECLLVEKELSELGEEDIHSFEREALEDDPELLAQVR